MPVVTRSQSRRIEAASRVKEAQIKYNTTKQQFVRNFREYKSQFIHVKEHATGCRQSLTYDTTQLVAIDKAYCLQIELLTKIYELARNCLPTLIETQLITEPNSARWTKLLMIFCHSGCNNDLFVTMNYM